MLELRPNCERCNADLPPDADARICAFECTFCADCGDDVLTGVCPNCGGGLERRPVRPAALLKKFPPAARISKAEQYAEAAREIAAVIEGEPNLIARMATVSNVLHHTFEHYFWTGFYLVDPQKPDELVIGPYQGTLGCLRIPFGKGVCGTAAAAGQTQVVDDVHAFPGHIACDARSASEIVAPLFDHDGRLIAVFDVDSDRKAMFDQSDREGLEAILRACFGDR